LVTSVPLNEDLEPETPKLTEGAWNPSFDLASAPVPLFRPTPAETPRLTPNDEDLPLVVSVSVADWKVIAPGAVRVCQKVAEISTS
jgi:hypothetical protein